MQFFIRTAYLERTCRHPSSVTACAVPPSPRGKAWACTSMPGLAEVASLPTMAGNSQIGGDLWGGRPTEIHRVWGVVPDAPKNVYDKKQRLTRVSRCNSYSLMAMAICTSSSCFWDTVVGASIIRSWAVLFMGKVMTSRMDSSPHSSMTIRSMPGAAPAWGGAP